MEKVKIQMEIVCLQLKNSLLANRYLASSTVLQPKRSLNQTLTVVMPMKKSYFVSKAQNVKNWLKNYLQRSFKKWLYNICVCI